VRFYLEIFGIPQGARYYRQFYTNMDMTVAGFIYTYSISNYISGGAYLNDDYNIARYQEYDTIWWRDQSQG
jgi:hypothetical protein